MLAFSNIRQNLENIDYSWNKPQTYLVFVPGLSLIIQKIQFSKVLPLIDDVTPSNIQEAASKSKKFTEICKWHLRGSLIQLTVALIAIHIFAIPFFSLIVIFAGCELIDTIFHCLKNNPILYEFHANGAVKKKISVSALNIF